MVAVEYRQGPEYKFPAASEDVAKVYPELVVRNAKGEIDTVQYVELVPVLLQRVQDQQRELNELKATLVQQNQELNERLAQIETATRSRELASR